MRVDNPVQIRVPLERKKTPEQVGSPLGREEANCTDLRPHMAGPGRALKRRVSAGVAPHMAGPGKTLRRRPPPGPYATGSGRVLRGLRPSPHTAGPYRVLGRQAPAGPSDGGLRPGPHTVSPFRALRRRVSAGFSHGKPLPGPQTAGPGQSLTAGHCRTLRPGTSDGPSR